MSGSIRHNVVLKVKEGSKEKVVKAAKELVKDIKKAEGCLACDFYEQVDGDAFAFIEDWDSIETLEKDMEAPYTVAFLKEFEDDFTLEVSRFKLA